MNTPELKQKLRDRAKKQSQCLKEIGSEIFREYNIDPQSDWVMTLIDYWYSEYKIYLNLTSRIKN